MANTINSGARYTVPFYASTGTDLSSTSLVNWYPSGQTLQVYGGSIQLIRSSPTSLAYFNHYHNTADTTSFTFGRHRGSVASPMPVQAGDTIGRFTFRANSAGTTGIDSASIYAKVEDGTTVSSGNITSRLTFATRNGASLVDKMSLTSNGRLLVNHVGPMLGRTVTINTNTVFASTGSMLTFNKEVPVSGGFPDSVTYTRGPTVEYTGGETKFGKWRQYHNSEELSWCLTYNAQVDPHNVFPAVWYPRDSVNSAADIVFANRIDVAEGHSGQNFWAVEFAPGDERQDYTFTDPATGAISALQNRPPDWNAGSSLRMFDGGLLCISNSAYNNSQWSTSGQSNYVPSGNFVDAALQLISNSTGGATGYYSHVVRTDGSSGSFRIQDVTEFGNSGYWMPITPRDGNSFSPTKTSAQVGIYDVMVINKTPKFDVSFAGPVRKRTYRYTNGNGTYECPTGLEVLFLDSSITSLTVTFPSSPVDGQTFTITTWGAVSGLVCSAPGTNLGGAITSLSGQGFASWCYFSPTSAWARIG